MQRNYHYTKAETSDGTIQINLTVDNKHVSKTLSNALSYFADSVTITGFRKGKAPLSKVKENVDPDKLRRKVIEEIIPAIYTEVVKKENIKPIVVPRIELISTDDDKDWQVRLTTCELPKVSFHDYKNAIRGESASKSIWTPNDKKKELTHDEKETLVKKILLEKADVKIPKLLISEEVESRLSQLLDRLEKLGIDLESYLSSIGKTPKTLREEYEKQSQDSLSIDLILNSISEQEKTNVSDDEIKKAIDSYGTDEKTLALLNKPGQQSLIKSVLRRRKTLENLISIIN